MLPIAATKQSQTRFDDESTDIRGSTSNLLQVPEGKAAGLRKWKGFTKMFGSKKQSSPSLRQKSLVINIDGANRVPYDIGDLMDADFVQSPFYSPELAAIVSSEGRSRRWGLYLAQTPADDNEFLPDRDHRDKGERTDRGMKPEEEGVRRPTLYLVLDTDQDPSCPSQVNLLVGTMEEFRSQTGGGDELEWGL